MHAPRGPRRAVVAQGSSHPARPRRLPPRPPSLHRATDCSWFRGEEAVEAARIWTIDPRPHERRIAGTRASHAPAARTGIAAAPPAVRGVLRRADLGKRVDDRVPRPQRPVEEQAGAFDGEPVPIEGICVLPTGRGGPDGRGGNPELNVIVDDVLATGRTPPGRRTRPTSASMRSRSLAWCRTCRA